MDIITRRFEDAHGYNYNIRIYPNGCAQYLNRVYTSFRGARQALSRCAVGLKEIK